MTPDPLVSTQAASFDWRRVLERRSFIEYDALERARALLDDGSMTVLCGPFDRLESPWLEPQNVTPQEDDGVVIARGTIDEGPVVIASIEQLFQGGAIGEVSGAKISQALRLAAVDSRAGTPTGAVLLLETGGVRLQEANLGLNAVAEMCSAVLELRTLAPVIGIVAGSVGSFGGVSIAAGLCTRLIVTREGRIGLNGAAVIESEAGVEEFDSNDRSLIWAIDGGEQRRDTGLADSLVNDDVDELRSELRAALKAGVLGAGEHRSERLDVLRARLQTLDPAHPPAPHDLRQLWGPRYELPAATPAPRVVSSEQGEPPRSRGRSWLTALAAGASIEAVIPSVLSARSDQALYLAVVPDPGNPFYRARAGQVGLTECLALAEVVRGAIADDSSAGQRRAIVSIVDLPSQAYGRIEEMTGLHQTIAATVDAYEQARVLGHPTVALVVGTALSGGFLAHGLQAAQLLALDDPGVEIHAMHKAAAAKITLRTVEELDELAKIVLPLSYNVRDWSKLGFCDELLEVDHADAPSQTDVAHVSDAIDRAIDRARRGPLDLSNRLDSPAAITTRAASRAIRDALAEQWTADRQT